MNNLNMQGGHIETVVQNKVDVHVSLGESLKEIASRISLIPFIATAGMLVATNFYQFPPGYYTGLRVAVSLCIVLCVAGLPRLMIWPALAVLVLYNPIWPIYLARDVWRPVNLATAGALAVLFICAKLKAKRRAMTEIQQEELEPSSGDIER